MLLLLHALIPCVATYILPIAVTVYEKTCLQTDRQTHTHTHTRTDYNNPPAHARGLMTKLYSQLDHFSTQLR